MNKLLDIKTIIILVLSAILFAQNCNKKKATGSIIRVDGKKYEVVKHTIDTQYIVKNTIEYRKGDDIYHETIIHDTIPANVDTLAVLAAYFAKVEYRDTLKLEYGYVAVTDTISQNKILGRAFVSELKLPEIKETLIVKDPPRVEVYLGLQSQLNKSDIVRSLGSSLIVKSKTDHLYLFGVGYDIKTNAPHVALGAAWKLKF